LIVPDFLQLDGYENQLTGYDACFFCAGISSVGMKEDAYSRITYDTSLHFAQTLVKLNPKWCLSMFRVREQIAQRRKCNVGKG
jgi:hypothetical protein